MGRCEKCPFNLGITTAENVVGKFNPEAFNDPDSEAVKIRRNTSMARAAFEEAAALIDCQYDPDPPAPSEPEGLDYDEMEPVDLDSDEAQHTPSPQELAIFQMLAGGNQPARMACVEHFQIALGFLTVNTQTGPETVHPDGFFEPTHRKKQGGDTGQGQYL